MVVYQLAAAALPVQSPALAHPALPVHHCSRRGALVPLLAAAAIAAAPQHSEASTRDTLLAPGSAERCEYGEGEACERLAEGNPYILALQKKSRAGREEIKDKLFDKTVTTMGYDGYFGAIDKSMVQAPDGSYRLLDAEEYSRLRKQGKIKPGAIDKLVEMP